MEENEYLTIKEVAEKLRVTPTTIQRFIYKQVLESLKIGGSYRIPKKSFEAFLKASTVPTKKT